MKWKNTFDGINYFIKIEPELKIVVCWEEGGTGDPREMGGNCSFDEFMKGTFRNLIKQHHGEAVLNEVIATVKEIRKLDRKK